MNTLVLDQGYAPQRIVPWQRAVGMLFGDRAEVVEDYDELIASVSLSTPMPAVVRMRRMARRHREVRFCRAHVVLRDGSRCQYCGVVQHELTFDQPVKPSWLPPLATLQLRDVPAAWQAFLAAAG